MAPGSADPTLADMSDPMHAARGAVILAEYVQPMQSGRWLIGGTLTGVICTRQVCDFPAGLSAYLRFQVERAGSYAVSTVLVVRNAPPNAPPLVDVRAEVQVRDPNEPVQMAVPLPPFRVECPCSQAGIAPGQEAVVHLSVLTLVADQALAGSPLRISFRAAPGEAPPAAGRPPGAI